MRKGEKVVEEKKEGDIEESGEDREEQDEEEEVADGGLGSEMQPPTAHQTKGNARTAQQAVPPWAGLAHPRLRPFPLVGGWRLASCSGREGRALDVLADAAEASGTLRGIVEALPRETYLPLYSLPPPPLPTRHLVWRRWRRKGKQRQTCSSKEGRELSTTTRAAETSRARRRSSKSRRRLRRLARSRRRRKRRRKRRRRLRLRSTAALKRCWASSERS